MRVRVIDTDGSLPGQAPLAAALAQGWGQRVDLTELGPALRLWARSASMRRAAALLAAAGEPPGGGPIVNFLGSGDFHHLAALLIGAQDRELSVLHFDNHPDWVRFAPDFHCGSWVNRVLAMDHVRRVVTIGVCSDDLQRPQIKGGNLAALASGKLEIYPWRQAPSLVLSRIDPRPSGMRRGLRIHWRTIADDFNAFLAELTGRVPTGQVWLSIDKDVLRLDDAVTNWDQGEMPLSALTAAIVTIGRRLEIVGADICGEFSEPRHRQWSKRWEAWTDQPARLDVDAADLRRNEQANGAILNALDKVLH